MADYIAESQSLKLNNPVLFTASIPCSNGNQYHRNGDGIISLCGKTRNCFSRYSITFAGNIAIPTGGTVGPIGLAIAVNGEPRPSSLGIVTPAAVDQYGNVTCIATVDVPRGCCFSVSVRCVSASDDPTFVPTPVIDLNNGLMKIVRTV